MSINPYLLLHSPSNRDSIYFPLKGSLRIKYTCFNVSKNFIVFGATSGGLYIFKRATCSFLQLIPNKEGSVNHVIVSPDEQFIAFSTVRNIVGVVQLDENTCGRLITRSEDLTDCEITALHWSDYENTLFIGDDSGRVSQLKLSFLNTNIINLPAHVLIRLESRIVQLCWHDEMLLISTLSRCYICDTIKEQYKPIGQQLRNGKYGACFLINENNLVRIFCARPGFRLWEVDSEGTVRNTHQFRHRLSRNQSTMVSLSKHAETITTTLEEESLEHSANITKLYNVLHKYVFTYKREGIYIFDVDKVDMLLWNNSITDIIDAQCLGDMIYIWTASGDLHQLSLLSLDQCLLYLYNKKYFSLCADLIAMFIDNLLNSELSNLLPLIDIDTYLDKTDTRIGDVQSFIDKLKITNKQVIIIKTEGIVTVNNNNSSHSLPIITGYQNGGIKTINDPIIIPNAELYPTSIIALASQDILQETISELSTSVVETLKLDVIREKLQTLNPFTKNGEYKPVDIKIEGEVEDIKEKKEFYKIDDSTEIGKICREIEMSDNLKDEKLTINLLNTIITEHYTLNESDNNFYKFSNYFPNHMMTKIHLIFYYSFEIDISKWLLENEELFLNLKELKYPNVLEKTCDKESLKIDLLFRELLFIFSELMDPYTILNCFRKLNLKCYYQCLCYILDYFQRSDTLKQCYNNENNNKNKDWPLPVFLDAMLLILNLGQIDNFCDMALKRNVSIIELSYILLKLLNDEDDDYKYNNIFLTYITKSNEGKNDDVALFNNNSGVLAHVILSFLSVNNSEDILLCECWFPLPISNIPDVKYAKVGKLIISFLFKIFSNNEFKQDLSNLINFLTDKKFEYLCFKNVNECNHKICNFICINRNIDLNVFNAFCLIYYICCNVPRMWIEVAAIQKENVYKIMCMEHFIQLGLIEEMNAYSPSVEICTIILQLNTKLKDGYCLNCDKNIKKNDKGLKWSQLMIHILEKLPREQVMQLINQFHPPKESLTREFFQSYILSAFGRDDKKIEKKIISSVLDFPSANSFTTEVDMNLREALYEDTGKKKLLQVDRQSRRKNHWGTSIEIRTAACVCCWLPLDSDTLLSDKNGGIVVFKCGHLYHTICLKHNNSVASCIACNRGS